MTKSFVSQNKKNNLKVVFIGVGIISNRLLSSTHVPCQIVRFGIRALSGNVDVWNGLINECISADLIVYLAYHHRDLPLNVLALAKLLRNLKAKRWGGRFVFINTQSILVGKIVKHASPLPTILSYDLYTTTKKIQSRLIEKYSLSLTCAKFICLLLSEKGLKHRTGSSLFLSMQP